MTTPDKFPVPSKKSVRKAGNIIRNPKSTEEDILKATIVISQWRSLFGYPLNTMQALVRERIKKLGIPNTIVARRLKRMPSIIGKLKRFPDMQLDRIQDIGGLRVVVKTTKDVYDLYSAVAFAKHQHRPVIPPHDYIMKPKADGYRSLHVVFKYHNLLHPELNDLPVELQIRTHIQHYWATALETLDIIENSSLKTGQGEENSKKFFKLASALFSIKESLPVLDEYKNVPPIEIVEEFDRLESDLNILDKLQGIAASIKHIETRKSSAAFRLLILNTKEKSITLKPYSLKKLSDAEEKYLEEEEKNKNNPDIDIVLISAGNARQIKNAYPNYFLDTRAFKDNLIQICRDIKKKKNL